jgi:hypothetical protein
MSRDLQSPESLGANSPRLRYEQQRIESTKGWRFNMSDLWNKAKELAAEAGIKVSDAGKAIADTAGKMSDETTAAAKSAWESTKATASAAADEASALADSAAKAATDVANTTAEGTGKAVEATKMATADAVDAVKKGLA